MARCTKCLIKANISVENIEDIEGMGLFESMEVTFEEACG
jgi:hypothetical protein